MLDKFVAACAAWERVTESSWLSGLMGTLNGMFAAVMLSVLWMGNPIFAVAAAIVLVIAGRFLDWTRAYIVGMLAGAALTVAIELSLFWFR